MYVWVCSHSVFSKCATYAQPKQSTQGVTWPTGSKKKQQFDHQSLITCITLSNSLISSPSLCSDYIGVWWWESIHGLNFFLIFSSTAVFLLCVRQNALCWGVLLSPKELFCCDGEAFGSTVGCDHLKKQEHALWSQPLWTHLWRLHCKRAIESWTLSTFTVLQVNYIIVMLSVAQLKWQDIKLWLK